MGLVLLHFLVSPGAMTPRSNSTRAPRYRFVLPLRISVARVRGSQCREGARCRFHCEGRTLRMRLQTCDRPATRCASSHRRDDRVSCCADTPEFLGRFWAHQDRRGAHPDEHAARPHDYSTSRRHRAKAAVVSAPLRQAGPALYRARWLQTCSSHRVAAVKHLSSSNRVGRLRRGLVSSPDVRDDRFWLYSSGSRVPKGRHLHHVMVVCANVRKHIVAIARRHGVLWSSSFFATAWTRATSRCRGRQIVRYPAADAGPVFES